MTLSRRSLIKSLCLTPFIPVGLYFAAKKGKEMGKGRGDLASGEPVFHIREHVWWESPDGTNCLNDYPALGVRLDGHEIHPAMRGYCSRVVQYHNGQNARLCQLWARPKPQSPMPEWKGWRYFTGYFEPDATDEQMTLAMMRWATGRGASC